MPLRLHCPNCAKPLNIPDSGVGQRVRCSSCRAEFVAFAPGAEELQTVLPVDEPQVEGVSDRPPAPAAAPHERPRPRLSREDPGPVAKGGRKWLLIVLGVGGLIQIGFIAAAIASVVWLSGRQKIADNEWRTFSPPDGRFSVEMPGNPQEGPVPGQAALNAKKYLTLHKLSDCYFAVAFIEVPIGGGIFDLAATASAERDLMLNATRGRVVREGTTTYAGRPAREFVVAVGGGNKGHVITRLFVEGARRGTNRLYMVSAGGSNIQPDTGYAARFFNSFALEGTKPPARPGDTPIPIEPDPLVSGPTALGELFTIQPSPKDGASRIAFSPDGRTLAASGGDFVRLFDATTGRRKDILGGQRGPVSGFVFTPDGRALINGSSTGTLYIRHADTGKERVSVTPAPEHKRRIDLVACSPDSSRVAFAAAASQTLIVCRLPGADLGQPMTILPLISDQCFAPDSRRVAVCTGNSVQVWDVEAGKQLRRFSFHDKPLWSTAFSPDNNTVAGTLDSEVILWDFRQDKEVGRLHGQGAGKIYKLVYSADGRLLVAACEWYKVQIWDTGSRKLLASLPHKGHQPVVDVALSRDGKRLASLCGGLVKVWDLPRALEAHAKK